MNARNQWTACVISVMIVLLSGASDAQDKIPVSLYPTVDAQVDRNEILIGDVIQLTLTITHDPTVEIVERGKNFNLGQFEIKDILPGETTTLPDGKIQRTDIYKLSTYFTGDFEIPPFDLTFKTADEKTGSFSTSPIKVHVRSLTDEEAEDLDIRDIKKPWLLTGASRLWIVLTAAGGLLLILLAAYFLWRYYKTRKVEVLLEPPLPAHERAYKSLEALRERTDLIEGRQFKLFSILVSEILRVYIHQRWGIMAMDFTTEEIMDSLNELDLNPPIRDRFQEFFDGCDLMKFAKHEPADTIFENLIDIAKHIVDDTREEPVIASTNNAPQPERSELPVDESKENGEV